MSRERDFSDPVRAPNLQLKIRESCYTELKRAIDILHTQILNASLPSTKEPGFADASTALKGKEETKKTKKLRGGMQESLSSHSKITTAPTEQMRDSSLGIFPEGFRSL